MYIDQNTTRKFQFEMLIFMLHFIGHDDGV